MKFCDRKGNKWEKQTVQDKQLAWLYESYLGRKLLHFLVRPTISKIGGRILDTKLSTIAIQPFIKKNQISMEQYEETEYCSYNDFFIRKIKKDMRPIAMEEDVFISPCDGKVSAYRITNDGVFSIKNTDYTIESLTKSKKIAHYYKDGIIVILRLTVDDYHRYCYPATGYKTRNFYIQGQFHTVNPIANDFAPIYKENTREYTLIKTKEFGTILQMEVGAMLVGKISNYEGKAFVKKGKEKGRFEFGGSTVVLLLDQTKVCLDEDLFENTQKGYETIVRMGERIGIRKEQIEV